MSGHDDYRRGYEAGHHAGRRSAVRHAAFRFVDGVPEGRCGICCLWHELTQELWQPTHGLSRCRACWRVYFAAKQRGYTAVEAVRAARSEAGRAAYRLLDPAEKLRRLDVARAWKAANRDRVRETNRAWRMRRATVAAAGNGIQADAGLGASTTGAPPLTRTGSVR